MSEILDDNVLQTQADAVPVEQPRELPVHPLSSNQERKLVDYLEDKLLEITRNFKKRCVSRYRFYLSLTCGSQIRTHEYNCPYTNRLLAPITYATFPDPPDTTNTTVCVLANDVPSPPHG